MNRPPLFNTLMPVPQRHGLGQPPIIHGSKGPHLLPAPNGPLISTLPPLLPSPQSGRPPGPPMSMYHNRPPSVNPQHLLQGPPVPGQPCLSMLNQQPPQPHLLNRMPPLNFNQLPPGMQSQSVRPPHLIPPQGMVKSLLPNPKQHLLQPPITSLRPGPPPPLTGGLLPAPFVSADNSNGNGIAKLNDNGHEIDSHDQVKQESYSNGTPFSINEQGNGNMKETVLESSNGIKEIWIETKTGDAKVYYYNSRTRETSWTRPENCTILTHEQFAQQQQHLATINTGKPELGKPLLGAKPHVPQMQFPIAGPAPMFPPPAINPAKLMQVPAGIRLAATEWIEYKTPEGKPYYFSNKTQKSVWEKPKALVEFEDAMKKLTEEENSTKQEKFETETKQADKSKPVSSTPIAGTPWCIVQTGDGRKFFFNPSTKTSVWKKPKELLAIPNIDDIIAKCTNGEDVNEDLKKPSVPELIDLEKDEEEEEEDEDSSNAEITEISSTKRTLTQESEDQITEKKLKTGEEEARKQMGVTSVEALASKQRETIPLEERVSMFTEMLEERDVSAFSTWEKELHKIVFDSRYLLLTSKERKATFEKYTRERADKERREKESKMKKGRTDFKQFVRDRLKHIESLKNITFGEFAADHSEAAEWRLLERNRDREQMFNEVLVELKKREKERARERFMDLLSDKQKHIHRHSRFSDVKKFLRDDYRYRAIEVSVREELFRSFIAQLRHRRKDIKEELDEGEIRSSEAEDNAEEDFCLEKEFINEEQQRKAEEQRNVELEKQRRVEKSLRERERQVRQEMQGTLAERDRQRAQYKQQELVENFNILLLDLIRCPELSWREAKRLLKRDHRYALFGEPLPRAEREALFETHLATLLKKRRKLFIELLDERVNSIALNAQWREVRKLIKDDPRYVQMSEKRCEKEFTHFMRERMIRAKHDFRSLLKETKIITHKSKRLIESTDQQHLADIVAHLQNDRRYLDLDMLEDERRQLILDYIEELQRKGTPPPPTASDPRKK